MSWTRLMAIARKELLQLRRDRRSLAMGLLLPVLLLVIFGYAISWDVSNIATAVLDQDRTAESRTLLDAFRASGYFALEDFLDDPTTIRPTLERGQAQIVLVIPPGFAADLGAGKQATVQLIADGSDANTATIVLAYAQAILQTQAEQRAAHLHPQALLLPVGASSRVWYNEELASRNMIVPGLVAVVMMIIAAMLTSLTIAREWERGTMEQLAATPVTRVEVVLGKLLPYLGIGLVDVAACSLLGVLLFRVPLRGSPLLLMGLSLLFLVGASGLGMFISAVARSQLLASQMAMLITFLPAYLLSGFMFSISVMPAPLRLLTFAVPARYFLVVTRGIFLKGVGLHVLYRQAWLMVAFAAVGLLLAIRVFRKELA